MKIDDLTVGEAKQLASMFGGTAGRKCPFEVGRAYLIRTVTVYVLGRVREVVGNFLVLDDASYVADTGRFSEAFKSGKMAEIERVPDGEIVSLNAVCDAQPWLLEIPKESV